MSVRRSVGSWFLPVLPESRVAVLRTVIYLFVIIDMHLFVRDPIPLSRHPELYRPLMIERDGGAYVQAVRRATGRNAPVKGAIVVMEPNSSKCTGRASLNRLVEGGAAPIVWASAVGFTLLICAISFAFFVRFRSRIAFWV